ncbi:TPA: hypothetical protein N0F65_010843 [Lagenidium giganteum]|uniref:Tc1-like transposase DDE domain-containing protein n=1 Tax=Lagenidium giganteum TaxID=4803 RepID=A0AAV2Z4D5_9STRA|nr:TPA: hypothetical protein N0F65_010843 [Lagenidium giganteum]
MDGATYHKRVLDPRPTIRWNEPEISDWFTSKSVSHTIGMLKKELLDLVAKVGGRKRYTTRETAREHGHSVAFTPPYHPELQPIELAWATLKNRIAQDPASSMDELKEKIANGLREIGESQLLLKMYDKARMQYGIVHIHSSAPGTAFETSARMLNSQSCHESRRLHA